MELDDITMIGIDQETYEKCLAIAKKENKSVAEVISDALKKYFMIKFGG